MKIDFLRGAKLSTGSETFLEDARSCYSHEKFMTSSTCIFRLCNLVLTIVWSEIGTRVVYFVCNSALRINLFLITFTSIFYQYFNVGQTLQAIEATHLKLL
jgi:hypothetical protein